MQSISKQDLRERILTLLRNQKEEERLRKSLAIQEQFLRLPEFKNSQTILFYASFDGEVNTFGMIKQAKTIGKTIGLPKIIKSKNQIVPTMIKSIETDLEQGPFGIKQPKEGLPILDLENLDLVVVPGLAFDKAKHRLGRGAGYYDRFLKSLSPATPTVGLAFDFQIVDFLPEMKEHDIPVSRVLMN